MPSEAPDLAQAQALEELQAEYITDLAHADMGPGHRHLLERLAGLFESRCHAPLTSGQLYGTSGPGVYENSGMGVRNQSERVYENLRNPHQRPGHPRPTHQQPHPE